MHACAPSPSMLALFVVPSKYRPHQNGFCLLVGGKKRDGGRVVGSGIACTHGLISDSWLFIGNNLLSECRIGRGAEIIICWRFQIPIFNSCAGDCGAPVVARPSQYSLAKQQTNVLHPKVRLRVPCSYSPIRFFFGFFLSWI